ncbi:MAG: hypothetical protein WAL37_02930 [Xanthobacteraceae bacterium]
MPKPVDSGPAKAATVRRECRPGSAYRRICGVQVQANGKANRPSMRCGRKGQRPSRAVEGARAPIAQNTGVTPTQSQQSTDAPNAPAPSSNPVSAGGVAVLKSGVVNGMPYTLYSDGSIEAQLPGGMLRFGSITELRNHIEQSA